MSPRAEAVIDLSVISHNIASLRAPGVATMAVVKADAYGHGAVPVSRAARRAGAEWLGVALPAEALTLRAAGDSGPILAWLYAPGDPDLAACVEAEVDLNAGAPWAVGDIAAAARAVGRRARVHLKVDTGLGRGGCAPGDWPELLAAAQRERQWLDVVGVWSHLACADVPNSPETDRQRDVFGDALAVAQRAGVEPRWRHLASSGAAMTRVDTHFDLVRVGIAMYGVPPGAGIDMGDLRPAMEVRASLASVKRVPQGHGVSYGLTWRAPRETTIALVPMGYADGIPRTARDAEVSVNGVRMPVVGRIAMDQFVIDAGDTVVAPGDEVIVWGAGTRGEPTAEDWARWDSTIGYEIVTRLGSRIPRRYVGE